MSLKIAGIFIGAVAAGALVGLGIYELDKRGKLGSFLRTPLVAGDAAECADKCSQDANCKSYSYNAATGQCVTSAKDPYTSWAEDPAFTLYVRRDASQGESRWSDWTPSSCPPCGDPATSRHRTCVGAGHCPGSAEMSCNIQQCQVMEQLPHNAVTIPYEDVSGKNRYKTVDGQTRDQCDQLCVADPTCTAVDWIPKTKQCQMLKNYTPNGIQVQPADWGDQYSSVKISDDGAWGPWPQDPSKPCPCGTSQITRPCKKPPCNRGISYARCVSSSCAYDVFPNMVVS